ncbi:MULTISPECIES: hypothetical protein [Eikenella]|uniref:hypothetical protein n=1 Tax=Eikenella TaxID=538 RepID=UPI0008A1E3F9|nr:MULTISPECIES: hypothetical protein [Eikenella]OFN57642.1 hypothetical protein HMPREF2541_11400 [Eikenella sp. HMSC061C02]
MSKPESNRQKNLLYAACALILILLLVIFFLVGNNRQPTNTIKPTAENRLPAIASSETDQDSKSNSERVQQFMNGLKTQDAQAVFAYLQQNKELEATWTAASKETVTVSAFKYPQIPNGFVIETNFHAISENGRETVYNVLMADENTDGVIDRIIYTNVQNRSDEHVYHNPTDETSVMLWEVALRELARASRLPH